MLYLLYMGLGLGYEICCKQIEVDLLYYCIIVLLVRKVKGEIVESKGRNSRNKRESAHCVTSIAVLGSGYYSTPESKRKGALLLPFLAPVEVYILSKTLRFKYNSTCRKNQVFGRKNV